jgi:hypothetical protein
MDERWSMHQTVRRAALNAPAGQRWNGKPGTGGSTRCVEVLIAIDEHDAAGGRLGFVSHCPGR